MLTYSCPFYRDGEFSGVVTADLSIQYFRELHNPLAEAVPGPGQLQLRDQPGGTFVYHPNPRYEFPAAILRWNKFPRLPTFWP